MEGSLGSKRSQVNLLEKKEPTARHLGPLDKHPGKQGCNCRLQDHKILTLAKIGQSTFALQFYSCSIAFSFASLFVSSSSYVIYLLLFVILPVVSNSHSFNSARLFWVLFSIRSVTQFHPIIRLFSFLF